MQISYGEYFIQVNMKDSSSKVKLVSFRLFVVTVDEQVVEAPIQIADFVWRQPWSEGKLIAYHDFRRVL